MIPGSDVGYSGTVFNQMCVLFFVARVKHNASRRGGCDETVADV